MIWVVDLIGPINLTELCAPNLSDAIEALANEMVRISIIRAIAFSVIRARYLCFCNPQNLIGARLPSLHLVPSTPNTNFKLNSKGMGLSVYGYATEYKKSVYEKCFLN